MEIDLGSVVTVLAEAVSQNKVENEASVAIGTIKVKGRLYQVQATIEPIKAKHIEAGKVVSDGKVVVEDTRTLFPDDEANENPEGDE